MLLKSVKVGPFRSMNEVQSVAIDQKVTAFVGMNEAGKTVMLKSLAKAADALASEKFDPIEDFPRKDLSTYLKNKDTNTILAIQLIYSLNEEEVRIINEKLGVSIDAGLEFSILYHYNNTQKISIHIDEKSNIDKIKKEFSTDAQTALEDCKLVKEIPDLLKNTNLTETDKTVLNNVNARIEKAGNWNSVCSFETWLILSPLVPKFLYFDDYNLLPGKMNLADLVTRFENSKSDSKHLNSEHRSILALLRMADISLKDISQPGGYEELKSKIEGISISLTDQVMNFWKQNEGLEVEVDIKADPTDTAPFNNGPNLYLRIKNRRHRGVSTPFGQRSRGFIWFFSFLVWFDSVQYQLDPSGKNAGQKLILLLDEPGLALHALAQADFLRYIDNLSENHQVLYTTHSPFMINSDRLHQVRIVEDKLTVGTVISENLSGADPRTIFPLQAALGWTIAQNLFISQRNLLVEGPSELIYLQLVSSFLQTEGRQGLRNDVTIVPTGGLDNVATFVSLLGASDLQLAVLHDYKGSPEQKLTGLVRDKLLSAKALLNVSQFRDSAKFGENGRTSDIEDLFSVDIYLKYFSDTFSEQLGKVSLTESDLPPGDRIVIRLEQYIKNKGLTIRPSGGFNHYTVANKFASSPPNSLDENTCMRFEALFTSINKIFS